MTQLELAITIAEQAFKDKTDKGGKPYFGHLERVAKQFKEDTYMHIVSYLHDLIEDCPEWNEKLLSAFFENRVVEAVVTLTKKKGEDYFDYIARVKENWLAKDVKIADLKDNMDITRLKEITERDIPRLQKYHKAYKILTEQ
jgi:(p)ppGpp synthase/HD superfamily hydrolase